MKENEDSRISLDRHRRHRKIKPWKNIIRILIFLFLAMGIYYYLTNLVEKAAEKEHQKQEENPNEIEVPIDLEGLELDSLHQKTE